MPPEVRKYTILRQGIKPPSSNWSDIRCPFCGTTSRAYHWSLAGGGKRCIYDKCRAKFDYFGSATRERE